MVDQDRQPERSRLRDWSRIVAPAGLLLLVVLIALGALVATWTTRDQPQFGPVPNSSASHIPQLLTPTARGLTAVIGSGDGVRTDHVSGGVDVTISGDATGELSPGSSVVVDVHFVNGKASGVVVSDLHVGIVSVSAPRATTALPCTTADYSVVQAPASLRVPVDGDSSTSLSALGYPHSEWPQVSMVNAPYNQSGCADATVTLHYTATGVTQ